MDQNQQLLTLRSFVNSFNNALNDQSYAGADGYVYNPPGQFEVAGPYGTAVEGQPITVSGGGSLRLSPGMLILVGAGLYWFLKKKG